MNLRRRRQPFHGFLAKVHNLMFNDKKHQMNQNEGTFYNLYFVMTSQIVDGGPWLSSASHSVFHILQNK